MIGVRYQNPKLRSTALNEKIAQRANRGSIPYALAVTAFAELSKAALRASVQGF